MAKVPFTDIGPVIRCSIERLQRPQEQQTEHHAGQTSHADLVIIQAQQPLEHPSNTRRSASAIQMASDTDVTHHGCVEPDLDSVAHFLAGAAELPAPRMALKKSLPWSSTITSDLLRKVAR